MEIAAMDWVYRFVVSEELNGYKVSLGCNVWLHRE